MLETSDGFKIAECDLMIRGPGDLLGTRQAGLPDFKIADLVKDEKILINARVAALKILKEDPNLEASQNRKLKAKVENDYGLMQGKRLN